MRHTSRLRTRRQYAASGRPRSILATLPRRRSALGQAHALCARAATVGFDWPGPREVLDKVREELFELETAFATRPRRRAALAWEIGDLFFALANLARHLDLDADRLVTAANRRFSIRFRKVEQLARARGIDMRRAGLALLDRLWDEAKKIVAADL